MTSRLMVALILLALPCLVAATDYTMPSNSRIKEWWKLEERKRPDEPLEIRDVKEIRLKSGKRAFLASVAYPERGHCCGWGVLLVRPDAQEAREVDSLSVVSEVLDLDYDGISEVVLAGSFLNQGVFSGRRTLLLFDGWNPVVLLETRFADNLGDCGSDISGRPCESEEAHWHFTDLDRDRNKELLEIIINKEGEEPDQLKWTTRVNCYKLKDNKLVRIETDLSESDTAQSRYKVNPRSGSIRDVPGDNVPPSSQYHQDESSEFSRSEKLTDGAETRDATDSMSFIRGFPSAVDQAATAVRDILSQFGLVPPGSDSGSMHER